MKEKDGNDSLSGARRTRSQAAPDWTVTESVILVNEIAAVEADWSRALSSHQQWTIIAENCTALDVVRNLNQCRRKWDSLFSDYNNIKGWESKSTTRCSYWSLKSDRAKKFGLPENFDQELFNAIDDLVKAREGRGETEPESDPEAGNEVLDVTVEMESKRKRQRSKSQRHHAEKPKKHLPSEALHNFSEEKDQRGCLDRRLEESHEAEPEKDQLEEEYLKDFIEEKPKLKCTAEVPPKGHSEMSKKSHADVKPHENHNNERPKTACEEKITICREENEETMSLRLQELAVNIQAICAESVDYGAAGSQNVEDYHAEFTRDQGDKLIANLGNFSNTLKQLCDLLQECK